MPCATGDSAMIELHNVTKTYALNGVRKRVAHDISFAFPRGESVALLGRNGAGKSTMLRMIAGVLSPDQGQIIRHGSVSWPVGFAGSFHGDLTGAQNTRFVGRTYGVDGDALIDFARDFARLGAHFHLPVRSYSSGMRARLTFGASMGIRFDTYLVDEVTAVGDAKFREKSRAVFAERMRQSGAIMVNHSMPQLRQYCESGLVLEQGKVFFFEDLDEAIALHEKLMK